MITPRFSLVTALIAVAVISQILPHPMNFSPVGAIALFSGAQFHDKRAAFCVPLIAMLVSDLMVGLHVLVPFVYGSFALSVVIGFWVRRSRTVERVIVGSLFCALLFFLVTNFGVWALLDTFPKSSGGLLACYVAGLPYFGNTLLSQFIYGALLFGGVALAERRWRLGVA